MPELLVSLFERNVLIMGTDRLIAADTQLSVALQVLTKVLTGASAAGNFWFFMLQTKKKTVLSFGDPVLAFVAITSRRQLFLESTAIFIHIP